MTEHDKAQFAKTMARLAIGLRDTAPDAAQMRIYFEALGSMEIEFLTAAAERLIATARWFPKPAEWAVVATTIRHEREAELRQRLRRLPSPLCAICSDTGWAPIGEGSTEQGWAETRVRECECTRLRRLEILGRRPMPELPPANHTPGDGDHG